MAIAVCLSYYTVAVFLWGYIAASDNPFSWWLLREVAPFNRALFLAISFSTDFLINLLIAYPFALLLFRLRRPELWIGIALFALGWAIYRSPLLLLQPWEIIWNALTSVDLWMLFVALVLTIFVAERFHPKSFAHGV